ncbi:hypothetical protein [Paenisporosarcina sp. OV554]|uniref:hypothetical protein n=1 Tax=Paenisporosarcina sp. OV554 TaxID=2135694 RepID=UPI000D4F608B|nr:hypothetical protein [Paenisporosarcina sp. OV554]PUB12589.1 hypothetical protein C8K15_10988 [Paenisporosarcina sp. OV554]
MKKPLKYFFNIEKLNPKEAFILGSLVILIFAVFAMCGWMAWENMQFLGWF